MPKKYTLLFIFASIIFLGHFLFSGQAIYGDGIDYWAYLPSIYFDHDIDFQNEYRHVYNPENNNSYNPEKAPEIQKTRYTSIGKTDNPHPPGTAIVWFPAFVSADAISAIFNFPRTGYANTYQIIVGLWSILLTTFALYLNKQIVYKLIKDRKIALIATLGIFFATPLLYYGSYDILNSHFVSFFFSSLTLYLILVKPIDLKSALLIGISIGLATLVRIQETLLLIPTFIYFYLHKDLRVKLPVIFFIWLILTLPLGFLWLYLYGYPLPETYTAFGKNEWLKFGSLFHFTNGLFFRTPIILLSLFGLKQLIQKEKLVLWVFATFFILQYILITFQGGWEAAAYGGRMYISTLPLFTILLAFALKLIKQKWSMKLATSIVILFSIVNMLSIASFVLFEKEVNSGRKRGLEEQTQEKVLKIINNFF